MLGILSQPRVSLNTGTACHPKSKPQGDWQMSQHRMAGNGGNGNQITVLNRHAPLPRGNDSKKLNILAQAPYRLLRKTELFCSKQLLLTNRSNGSLVDENFLHDAFDSLITVSLILHVVAGPFHIRCS